ncbi:hypothetical protein [Flavobacterium sp. J27]|uniref:hypothetical protein n=1 Tax=Flavobacterium sp. J27 TaxID=2060419 RepID=UPI001032111E|nr:hypothetical protein [Flavobacterium sp. J27]
MKHYMGKKGKRVLIVLISFAVLSLIFYSNQTIAILFAPKIMVHRVNSMEKLEEVKNKYRGVELDIVFDSLRNVFDVNHPPAKSIQLDLKTYFSNSKGVNDLFIWLDFKNLSESNQTNAINRLNEIVIQNHLIKKNIILETTNPKLALAFKDAGYKTSYYLPPYLYTKSKDSLAYYISIISQKNTIYPTDYLSFDYRDYTIVNKYFKTKKKLTWFANESSYTKKIPSKIKLYKILFDRNVHHVLLPYVSKKGNR